MGSAKTLIGRIDGFTLLELIIVVLLLGIMAVSLGSLTSNTVYSYIDAKDRNRLSQSSKWIIEKISREIREALPQSVRTGVNGNFHCVEFMAIENASSYLNLPASGNITSFNAVGYNLTTSTANLVAIMPINTSSLYAVNGTLGNVLSIATFAGDPNQVVINLTGATVFNRRSPQNRFYLLNTPVSFCLDDNNGQLLKYSNYAITATQQFPPAIGNQLGENFFANGTVFNYQTGTLSRAGLLQINLTTQNRNRGLTGTSESINLFHEVHVRNVP